MSENHKFLTDEKVLGAKDMKREWVEFPEWDSEGGGFYVRSLSAAERDEFEKGAINEDGEPDQRVMMTNMRARFAVLVCVDEDGKLIFRADQAEALGAKNSRAIDRIWDVGSRLSAMRRRDLEELEKN